MESNTIRSMHIQIPDEYVEDLTNRLRNTRWAPPITSSNWEDGTDGEYLRDLISYWATGYSWRKREEKLNAFHHFLANVDGVEIHFIYENGKCANPIPLLLMHGWPSSFVQMLDIIPLLTEERSDGTRSFDVVVASMPGYPFSQFPTRHGMNFSQIADILTKLMTAELGYEKFAARGSDQGALVQQQIGLKYPQHLIGLHRSGITPFANPLPGNLSAEELEYQKQVAAWAQQETAYARLQALRPETLVPALADSPVALASWFVEKFQRWGDGGNEIDAHFNRDALLDNISLHWFTNAGAAAIRLYREASRNPGITGRVEAPTAILMPLRDSITVPAPRAWAERQYNVQRWTMMERGGHFPEWELPNEVANDVRLFFSDLI